MKRLIIVILLLTGTIHLSAQPDLSKYPTANEEKKYTFVNQTNKNYWVVGWFKGTSKTKKVLIPSHHKGILEFGRKCLRGFRVDKEEGWSWGDYEKTVAICENKVFYIRFDEKAKNQVRVDWNSNSGEETLSE